MKEKELMELKGHQKEVVRKGAQEPQEVQESSEKRPLWTDNRVTCLS